MKKKFWLIGVTLTFLVSCTTNEVIDMPKGGTIGFDTYVGKASRAAVTATTGNLNEMYVVGYMTNVTNAAFAAGNYDPVFNDDNSNFIKATRNSTSGAWGYTPIKHWQKNKFYRFAAFTDANDNANDLTSNITYDPVADNLTITNMEMSPNTKDLVVAISGDRKTTEALSTSEVAVIPFAFRHAYSRIRITFTDAANVELKVTDLKIVNASTKGTGTFAFGQGISSVGKDDVKWNMTGYDGTGYEFPAEPIYLTGSTPVFDEVFVLPQSLYGTDEEPYDPLDGESENNDVKLSFTLVSYTVEDNHEEVIHETPIELPLAAPNVDCWESGMWYQYQIAFGTSYNEIPISFSVSTVHGWSTNLDDNPTTDDGQIDLGSTGVSQ